MDQTPYTPDHAAFVRGILLTPSLLILAALFWFVRYAESVNAGVAAVGTIIMVLWIRQTIHTQRFG